MVVLLTTTTLVAAADPNVTVAPAAKSIPVIVTAVPPATGPALGLTPVTKGTMLAVAENVTTCMTHGPEAVRGRAGVITAGYVNYAIRRQICVGRGDRSERERRTGHNRGVTADHVSADDQFIRSVCRDEAAVGNVAVSTGAAEYTSSGLDVSTPLYSKMRTSGLVAA